MPNYEKISMPTPKSGWRREVEEGVEEYQQRVQEAQLLLTKQANEIIDSFQDEEFSIQEEGREVYGELLVSIREKLAGWDTSFRNEIIKQWIARDPIFIVNYADAFGNLLQNYQNDIALALSTPEKKDEYWNYNYLLINIGTITDVKLGVLIASHASFSDLAAHRQQFPCLSDDIIINKALKTTHLGQQYWDYAALIPYVEMFSLNKKKIIEGALNQSINRATARLLEYRELLGISWQELFDLFSEHKKITDLISNISYFPSELHQKIIDSAVDEGLIDTILSSAHLFKGVDFPELFEKILATNNGMDKLSRRLGEIIELWGIQLVPQRVIDNLMNNFPSDAARAINKLGDRVDREKIISSLLKKDFRNLVTYRHELGIIDDMDLVEKIITAGGIAYIRKNLSRFHGLGNKIAIELIESGAGEQVISNIGSFQGINYKDVALKLINQSESHIVDNHPDIFLDISSLGPKIKALTISAKLSVSEVLIANEAGVTETSATQDIFESLLAHHPEWQDEANIAGPFRDGVAYFGYNEMALYLGREKLSRHDALHNFRSVIQISMRSGLSPAQFSSHILRQVSGDSTIYREGTAHHHLNAIAQSFPENVETVLEQAKAHTSIQKLQELVSELADTKNIFRSWKYLKKFNELQELLGKTELLDRLANLHGEGREQLAQYIETLAFHPGVDAEKVFLFWENPAKFLSLDDPHSPELHERKKPSNYTEFPNLDLTAEELRDALVDGSYDRLQVHKPLEITYAVQESYIGKSIFDLLREALGKRSENIPGKARNPNVLFKKIQTLATSHGVDIRNLIVKTTPINLDPSFLDALRIIIEDAKVGMPSPKSVRYRAKINEKSDPDAVVAGNDTSCCMPFGSGKNNIYTFNPICSLFTVQCETGEGGWRTVAQSVLTKDRDIHENVSGLAEHLNQQNIHLDEVIPEEALIDAPRLIACDNIETSPNNRDRDAAATIELIYRDFFREYLAQYSVEDHLDPSRVIIGRGYSDALTTLPTIPNTFIPEAPVAYSDKMGSSVYVLNIDELSAELAIISRDKKIPKKISKPSQSTHLPTGVSPLTFEDALPVSYLEGKAYRDNRSLIENLHTMENALIAKDVTNVAKGRPNMSFKYQGEQGKMRGYILAYEGVRKPEDGESKSSEPVVYVSDLAASGSVRAGGSLILAFAEVYKQEYLAQNKYLPIYAQMREQTSFRIIKKQLEKLTVGTGNRFVIEELGTYNVGEDTMHKVMIRRQLPDIQR